MKSLLDYIVDDLIDDGVPVTREGALDLLAVLSPAQITPLTASQATLADRLLPTMLVLDTLRDMNWQDLADKKVSLEDRESTVAELLHEDQYPLDFVLAGIRLPDAVCRWYVAEHLSEQNSIWPETADQLKTTDTRFSIDYVHEQVVHYLDARPVDSAWIHILGVPGVAKGRVKTTRELVRSLKTVLATGIVGPELEVFDKQGLTELSWVVNDLDIKDVKHFKQVSQVRSSFDDLTKRMKESTSDMSPEQKVIVFNNLIDKLKKEVFA
ncbi:MAG: hypothetical protein E6R03_08965 [Hyphomicrobiaceae bacterium]|nr:MAG: hypothetical protein E6R03_08965 [Hyphomicrobiaceae bacterium]